VGLSSIEGSWIGGSFSVMRGLWVVLHADGDGVLPSVALA
jgi:hypothetical protein